jgi:Tat protein secretion system quality control protein TatD with DNase activity
VFSAGVHPWEADSTTTKVWSALENLVIKQEVLMVGEIGLDKLKGPSLEVQMAVFKRQLLLAESVSKRLSSTLYGHQTPSWPSKRPRQVFGLDYSWF